MTETKAQEAELKMRNLLDQAGLPMPDEVLYEENEIRRFQ